MANRPAESDRKLGIHSLFEEMSEERLESVANRILGHLGRASPDSKRAFESELDRQNLRIPGFRRASRAPANLLTQAVQFGLAHSDDLAVAALRLWAESHEDLHESVSERLNDIGKYIGVSTRFPNSGESRLRGHWQRDAWERERDRLVELHDDADETDVELMICYLSGKLPAIEESEEDEGATSEAVRAVIKLMALCAVDLENLQVSAPEWESDIPELADRIAGIVSRKQEERSHAATLAAFIEEFRSDYSAELAYLESDIASWSANSLSSGGEIAKALGMCGELRSSLVEFRAIRESPPTATRSEEAERRKKNDELEDLALGLVERIWRHMSGNPMSDDNPSRKADRARDRSEFDSDNHPQPSPTSRDDSASISRFPDFDLDRLLHENISLKSEIDDLRRENEPLRTENGRLETENQTLRSENRTLSNDIQFLRADKADIERNVEVLQSKLTSRENDAETWRLAYEEESRIPRMTVKDVPMHIENVSDAVRYAEDMFPDRLLLKTNSKSQVRDNPFEKPEDVWKALKWLATSYCDARAGISSVPDFDLSVREACGWQYKSDQHETTRNKYREWYTTKTNNKTYWLLEHIGTGSSKDARHTIRIAFDWDKDEKLVVVGYIGQHQRTDAT